MRLNNYELNYKNGYFLAQEYKISKEGKEYLDAFQTFPSEVSFCKMLVAQGGVISELTQVCATLKKEYVSEESVKWFKEKAKREADAAKRREK